VMARRYPSSGNYDTGRYSRGYVPVNSSSYIGGPGPGDRQRQEPVSYRDRWLGSRTQTETDSYRHRSSSPDRQFRLSQAVSSAGPAAYRSRSWETSTSSNTRDRLHGRGESAYSMNSGSRNYLPSRSYGRSISFGKDSYLSPVTAPRKNESYTGGILKHTTSGNNDPPVSILTRGGSGSGDSVSGGSRRLRHNTLTFGVSGEDLDRARTNIQKYTRRLSDDTRPQLHSDPAPALSKKTTSRYSLPDVFDSLSGSNYYDSRLDRDNMVRDIMQSRGILTSSQQHHISSSYSGYRDTGVLGQAGVQPVHHSHHTTPTLMSSSLPSGIDISSLHSSSHGSSYQPSSGGVTSDRTPGSVAGGSGTNNEQTLKSLQKHYMNAITSLNPQLPINGSLEKAAVAEDPDAKKPTELIDDILKVSVCQCQHNDQPSIICKKDNFII